MHVQAHWLAHTHAQAHIGPTLGVSLAHAMRSTMVLFASTHETNTHTYTRNAKRTTQYTLKYNKISYIFRQNIQLFTYSIQLKPMQTFRCSNK